MIEANFDQRNRVFVIFFFGLFQPMAAAGTFSLKTEYQKRLGRHRQSDAAE